MNKRYLPIFLLLLVVIALSAVISLVVVRANNPPRFDESDKFDGWLHQQLNITTAQDEAMKPSEDEFHRKEQVLVEEIRRLNEELGRALIGEKENSAKVQEIVLRTHDAQGRLQQLTISHLFEMRQHLEPDQFDRLLQHAADALTEPQAPKH